MEVDSLGWLVSLSCSLICSLRELGYRLGRQRSFFEWLFLKKGSEMADHVDPSTCGPVFYAPYPIFCILMATLGAVSLSSCHRWECQGLIKRSESENRPAWGSGPCSEEQALVDCRESCSITSERSSPSYFPECWSRRGTVCQPWMVVPLCLVSFAL